MKDTGWKEARIRNYLRWKIPQIPTCTSKWICHCLARYQGTVTGRNLDGQCQGGPEEKKSKTTNWKATKNKNKSGWVCESLIVGYTDEREKKEEENETILRFMLRSRAIGILRTANIRLRIFYRLGLCLTCICSHEERHGKRGFIQMMEGENVSVCFSYTLIWRPLDLQAFTCARGASVPGRVGDCR